MKQYYKYEIARMAGVSVRTLERWLALHRTHLQTLGCRPRDKFLNPRALEWLCQEYCIQLDDA